MIRGLHAMFYSSQAEELRAFLRDKLDGAGPCSKRPDGLGNTDSSSTHEAAKWQRYAHSV